MKKIFTLSAAIIFSVNVFSQAPAIQWQKCLGGTSGDYAYSMRLTSDGGCIVAGSTLSNDGDVTGYHANYDYWVVKLDVGGNMQWQKALGGTGRDEAYSVYQTTDSGYIIAGLTESNDGDVSGLHGLGDVWVVKLDVSGNIQWQKCYGGTNTESARSIQQTSDGGYIIGGETGSNDGDVSGMHGVGDYWIVKLDGSGNIQWKKCYGGTDYEKAFSVVPTSDGGYIMNGHSLSSDGDVTINHGDWDYWVVKVDGSGNIQWQKSFGGSNIDFGVDIRQTSDGGYIVAGDSESNDGDVSGNHSIIFSDYWVVKLDGSGNIQWKKCYGGTLSEGVTSVQQTSSGDYIISGVAVSNDFDVTGHYGGGDFWIVRIDFNGNIQWKKCYGGAGDDIPFAIFQTSDGGYIGAGQSSSNSVDVSGNHGAYDFWVVKLGPDFTGIEEENILATFSLSPNPATNEIRIERSEFKVQSVSIYDLFGQKVLSEQHATAIDVSKLSPGIYFVTVRDEKGNRVTRKFVKTK